jgi:hypothetical protein
MRSWDSSPDTRWRSISGTQRNEKAVHDLQAAETQFKLEAADQVKREGPTSAAIERLQSQASPLDRANSLLTQANIPATLEIQNGELRARRGESVYSLARMSDGERAALILAGEIITAPASSVFVIDEPELHLHRSIVVPLLLSFIAERTDCGFIVSTHELELPAVIEDSQAVLVRGCTWSGSTISTWDVDLLPLTGEIPEALRIDILGSRRKILFIEGTDTSLDKPMYALLYPKVSVRSRKSCKDVIQAVEGVKAVEGTHHAQSYGIVDNDGMSADRMQKLEAAGIYPLSMFSVESLYYCREILETLAAQQAKALELSVDDLLSAAYTKAMDTLCQAGKAEFLASRISEQHLRDSLFGSLPNREEIRENATINLNLASPYPAELARLISLRDRGEVHEIINRYPVRQSGILKDLAVGLRYQSKSDYERAVRAKLGVDDRLREILRSKLGSLSPQLT